MESNWISYVNTELQYYLNVNPDHLSDEEWGEKYAQLNNIRQREAEANQIIK
jgi:hypothetical protein